MFFNLLADYHLSIPRLSAVLALCMCLKVYFARTRYLKGPLPPGPPGQPLLGNLLQLPKFQWLQFTQWKDKFGALYMIVDPSKYSLVLLAGPIFSLNLAGQRVVVLNTYDVASDLLGKSSQLLC